MKRSDFTKKVIILVIFCKCLQMGDQFAGQFEDESKMFSMSGNGGDLLNIYYLFYVNVNISNPVILQAAASSRTISCGTTRTAS